MFNSRKHLKKMSDYLTLRAPKHHIKDVRANCYCAFRENLCAHVSLISHSNAVFSFETRFYHIAFTQQYNWLQLFVIILNCVRIS